MNNNCVNGYKTSRQNAGFTQEQAVELISQITGGDLAVRTLSDYENGHVKKVPDEIVAAMADAYNCPILAWWHMKRNSPLGKFLPDIIMPQTNGDMAFQLVLAGVFSRIRAVRTF